MNFDLVSTECKTSIKVWKSSLQNDLAWKHPAVSGKLPNRSGFPDVNCSINCLVLCANDFMICFCVS